MPQGFSNTDFGLIGRPLAHSRSKTLFTGIFERDGSHRIYDNFELPALTPQALYSLVLMNPHLKGFNVTAPYKVDIMQYLDFIDDNAKAVGAVNTVKILRAADGRVTGLEGYNTDVIGFLESVRPLIEDLPAQSSALVFGTGGAARAVAHALKTAGMKPQFVSRKPYGDMIGYKDITPGVMEGNLLLVNATPLGTWPDTDECIPIDYSLVTPRHRAFDLVYNPRESEFLRR